MSTWFGFGFQMGDIIMSPLWGLDLFSDVFYNNVTPMGFGFGFQVKGIVIKPLRGLGCLIIGQ